MENATKALIIAGAILVAILLVTMGISLLSNTDGLQKQQDSLANSMDISSFNGKITPAVGNNVSGSKLKGVLENIYTMYLDYGDAELGTMLTISYTGSSVTDTNIVTAAALQTAIDDVRSTARYRVTTTKDPGTGYIDTLTIAIK